MSKERYNQIIDEAYKRYADSHWSPPENPNGPLLDDQLWSVIPMEHSKETFVKECKTNLKFSKKWGLKIEERELSLEERAKIATDLYPRLNENHHDDEALINIRPFFHEYLDSFNIPTRAITLTYKDEKIEVYE